MKPRNGSSVLRLAVPIKVLIQRFAFLLLILAAFGLMLLGKAETRVMERVSDVVVDVFAPIMDALSQPAAVVSDAVRTARELSAIRAENERLRRENARLLAWQEAAQRLMAQNEALMGLLDFKPDPKAKYLAARVIGDSGGAFVRSMLVNAGERDGVRKGQAVVTGRGLAGRIATVGLRSARVLLITDINSRVPVLVGGLRYRAILTGDNGTRPRLAFLPANAAVRADDLIVTSGHGGVFPPGLRIGRVALAGDGVIRAQPFVDFDRLEFVRVVDYAGVAAAVENEDGEEKAAAR